MNTFLQKTQFDTRHLLRGRFLGTIVLLYFFFSLSILTLSTVSESEESEESVSELELSLDEVLSEEESESGSIARLTLPFFDFLLFFFFFTEHLREVCSNLPYLVHFFLTALLTADLIAFIVALFSIMPAILSVISSTGSYSIPGASLPLSLSRSLKKRL